MLAVRNRRFRIAALCGAVAYLIGTAGGIVDANRLLPLSLQGGYRVSAVILPAAQLIGACGWFVVAGAFAAEIDWPRLRLGGTIVATTYIATAAALVLRFISVVGETHESRFLVALIAGAAAAILNAAAASVIVTGFAESRRGSARAARLRAGAILAIAASVAVAVGTLFLRASYSHLGASSQLTTGTILLAIGACGSGLAGLVIALAVSRPLGRREAAIAGAAVAVIAGGLCSATGEVLMATATSGPTSLLWVSWLAIATRAGIILGLLFVAFGARTAATSASAPD